MFGGKRGRTAWRALVLTAMLATVAPLAPGAAAVAGAAERSGGGPADGIDDGFEVVERSVAVDPARPATVTGDEHGHDHAAEIAEASTEVVHRGEPQLLIVSDVEPHTTLAIRSRNDGEWSDWVEVSADPGEAPDGRPGEEGAGTTAGIGPIWIGEHAERTEIALVGGDDHRFTVEELSIDDQQVPAVSGGGTGRANLRMGGIGVAAATAYAQPTIRPRSAWATSGMGWTCGGSPDTSDNLRAAVVHHTASTTSYAPADVPSIIRAFWRHHTQTNGWCDIAYNFLVDRFGTVWEGRAGGVDRPVIGGHAKGFNTWTTGVALIGEFGSAPAYSSMIGATQRLLAWKLSLHGVDPLGWTELENRATSGPMRYRAGALIHVPTVLGHRDLGLTSCPGSNVYNVLGSIRRGLASSERVGSPPYVFERWQPSRTGIALASVDSRGGIRVAGGGTQTSVTVSGTPIAIDGGGGRGYVLTADGRLTAFNGATPQPIPTVVPDPVDLVVRRDGSSGWVLGRNGQLAGFGGALNPSTQATAQAVAAALDDSGRGYVLLRTGALLPVGGAPNRQISNSWGLQGVDLVLRSDGVSGWVLTSDGAARGFGGAPTHPGATGASQPRALVLAGDESGVSVLDADGRLWPIGGAPAVLPIASHVGIPNAVDVGRLGRPGLATSNLAKVVTAQHELFLRSRPGPAGLERWYYRAERVGLVGSALDMARSDQYAGLIIDDLYRRVLGREADPGGRAGWLGAIRRGMRIETIAAAFYGSREYVQKAGSYERFVELLYENLLFRSSDPGGKAGWVGALYQGRLTPTQVAAGFYGSLESRRDRVTRLYQQILERAPDPGGLAHWSQQLITKDDLVLAADLAGSKEFHDRALRGA